MKPSDLFIGVIDFFSVLLPGALLTYFLQRSFYANIFGAERIFPDPTTEASRWAVFLLCVYIIGNLIFMMAAFLDSTYDKVLRKQCFQSKDDLAFKTARLIREAYINTEARLKELGLPDKTSTATELKDPSRFKPEILNTFKWAQHFLLFNKPEALAAIQRIEADSKFFRSLVVAFLIISVLLVVERELPLALFFFVLSLLSYYRYGQLRFKATEKAYELIITFFYQTRKDSPPAKEQDEERKSASDLKTDLTPEFATRHRELISFLSKGFSKPPKQIIITQEAGGKFVADRDEWWFCAGGRGIIYDFKGGEVAATVLTRNAIIPLKRELEYSVKRAGSEPVEIMSWEN